MSNGQGGQMNDAADERDSDTKNRLLYNPMRLLHGSQFHVPPVAFCSAA